MSAETVANGRHSWTPEHPHAKDKQWTIDGKVWSWHRCCRCKARTAATVGAGKPVCDACFDIEMKEMEES